MPEARHHRGTVRGRSDPRILGAPAFAALLLPLFLLRNRLAARPVTELALFRLRQFQRANVATVVFATAFYGTLLGRVIFRQTVWHYPVLRAARATAPSPLITTAVAPTASQLSYADGPRRVLTAAGRSRGFIAPGRKVTAPGVALTGYQPWPRLTRHRGHGPSPGVSSQSALTHQSIR